MIKLKYFLIILFFMIVPVIIAEDGKIMDHFRGVWAVRSQDWKIEEFIVIEEMDNSYLIITADTDDFKAAKGLGKLISQNIIEVELRGLKYKLVYGSEGLDEWIEMYLTPDDEEYPVYERIENFSIDKF